MKKLQFTKDLLATFKKSYELALENNLEIFTFNGHEFLTSYAKYLIEYLESKFGSN